MFANTILTKKIRQIKWFTQSWDFETILRFVEISKLSKLFRKSFESGKTRVDSQNHTKLGVNEATYNTFCIRSILFGLLYTHKGQISSVVCYTSFDMAKYLHHSLTYSNILDVGMFRNCKLWNFEISKFRDFEISISKSQLWVYVNYYAMDM